MVSVKMSDPWSHGTSCDDTVLVVFVLKVQFAKYDCDYLKKIGVNVMSNMFVYGATYLSSKIYILSSLPIP